MKFKEKLDSSGSSKSPTKKQAKERNSTLPSTGDGDNDHFDDTNPVIEERQESLGESRGENSNRELISQEQLKGISNADISENNSVQDNSIKAIFSMDDLSPDDEIYTFQCPQNYNKQDFYNKNLDFTKLNTSFTNKGEVFQVQFLKSDKKFITLAVPNSATNGSLVKLHLKGHVVIQKDVDIFGIEPMHEDTCDKSKVNFPNDIKVRHPLLGIDWKAHIDSAEAAFSKYNNSPRKKNKKRKKEKTAGDDYVEIKKIKQESSESEFGTPKKKKKKHESYE